MKSREWPVAIPVDACQELVLLPFQEKMKKFMIFHKKCINADSMGMGKTPTTLAACKEVMSDRDSCLIVAPKRAWSGWKRSIRDWLGQEPTLYTGTPKQRQAAWDSRTSQFVIVNLQQVKEIAALKLMWNIVILDEAHEFRNGKSRAKNKEGNGNFPAFRIVKSLNSNYLWLLTGSPSVNNPKDLWPLLHLVDRKRYSSFWKFVEKFCEIEYSEYGTLIGGIKFPEAFARELKPYMLQRKKEDVLAEFPIKRRLPWYIEMLPAQAKLYKQLEDSMILEYEGEVKAIALNELSQKIRMRQLLISPELLNIPEKSAIIETLRERLEELGPEGRSCVIFTPYREAVSLLAREIATITDPPQIFTIMGGMREEDFEKVWRGFQAWPSNKVMVSTSNMGTSWEAYTVDTAYIVGPDYVPGNLEQCEDRLHRIGQESPVTIYYFLTENTYEEHIFEVLDKKTTWNTLQKESKTFIPDLTN